MKCETEITKVLTSLEPTGEGTKYHGMTYEQGIEEALLWVLEQIPDEEFEFAQKRGAVNEN